MSWRTLLAIWMCCGAVSGMALAQETPIVKEVDAASRPQIPAGLKIACMTGPDRLERSSTCPVLFWHGYTYWVFSHRDNRSAVTVVAYDSQGSATKQWYREGSRYPYRISVDVAARKVKIWGQQSRTIEMTWDELLLQTPDPAELAHHWAPIHFQDINKSSAHGSKDFITSVDRDGIWNVTWNWQNFNSYPLTAWVYYSVVSADSHHYITYAFYHPLDWDSGQDNNDFEGALFIIRRNGSRWGTLEAIVTVWHTHFHAYFPTDTPLVSGCKIETQRECWIQWEEGRVKTSQEWGGHGVGCYPAYVKRGDDAVVYAPSRSTAGVPPRVPDGAHLTVPYRLVDIHEPGGLWDQRYNPRVFNPVLCYREMVGGHGNPPWAWDDVDDGGLVLRGAWTHDPALLAQYYFKLKDGSAKPWEYFSRHYESNPYRTDMTILTHSKAQLLYSDPDMSLQYWIRNHGGSCPTYSKLYPCQ